MHTMTYKASKEVKYTRHTAFDNRMDAKRRQPYVALFHIPVPPYITNRLRRIEETVASPIGNN